LVQSRSSATFDVRNTSVESKSSTFVHIDTTRENSSRSQSNLCQPRSSFNIVTSRASDDSVGS
jgi:hypothetical protein